MRSTILGLIIASAIAAGIANADETNQKDNRWAGFYAGVNGGLAESDSKETSAFGAQGSSSVNGTPNASVGTFSSDLTALDSKTGSLGMGSESNKDLGSNKTK